MLESQSKLVSVTIFEDIHVEILLLLPTKSVVRMKSVCKRWHSLISSHRFAVLHTVRQPAASANSTAFLLRRSNLQYYYHLSLQPCKTIHLTLPGTVIQSCNGLLLCRYPDNAPADYFIYNLATRLSRALDVDHNDIKGLTLAFEPLKSAYYKLIRVKAADPCLSQYCYQIDVFDSASSSWTVVEGKYAAPDDVVSFWGVYQNNAVHWVRFSGGLVYFDIGKGMIDQAPMGPEIQGVGSPHFTQLFVDSGRVMAYNRISGRFWELTDLGMEELNIQDNDVHRFVDTLAPV